MEYRAEDHFESLKRLLLNGLMSAAVIGIAWNLLKPGGWLFWIMISSCATSHPVSTTLQSAC